VPIDGVRRHATGLSPYATNVVPRRDEMTHRSQLPPIQVGAVLQLAEPDYRYGVRALKLRVTDVPEHHETLGGEWMCVHGMEIDWRGLEIQPRRVMVRVAVVQRHVAATGGGTRVRP
jgi:hypothetical protein